MPRKFEDLEKVTIRLFRGDFERLAMAYPTAGVNRVIRVLVRGHLHEIATRAHGRKEVVRLTLEEVGMEK